MTGFFYGKKGRAVYPFFVCLFPMLMALYCCIIKSGGFVDEYWSNGFANSSKGNNLMVVFDGDVTHRVITQGDLNEYISVDADEAFSFSYILKNCSNDLTPPLYYFILHLISSFFPLTVSKWFGLSINLVAFLVTLLFLYQVSFILFKSRWVSSLVTLCYGFSIGGLNNVTYIRMYAMVTMWSIILLYSILKLVRDEGWWYYVITGVVIYLGFLTQYNFGIFAFVFCAETCILLLCRKKIKKFLIFSASALSGVIAFFITWPHLFTQTDKAGQLNGKGDSGLFISLYYWGSVLGRQMETELLLLCILVILISVLSVLTKTKVKDVYREIKGRLVLSECIMVLTGGILSLVVTAYFAPFFSARYCFNAMPVLTLILGLLFWLFRLLLEKYFANKDKIINMNIVGVLFAAVAVIGAANLSEMKYLYLDNSEKLLVTDAVSSYPCIFINTNHDKAITNSIDHLVKFKDFYVTDKLTREEYDSYVKSRPDNVGMVVFVDRDPIGSSGLDSDEVMTEIAEMQLYDTILVLYELDSVTAFLLYDSELAE
ncbi:MAG: glycosyltransferase family 39 protein [Lachnospiraceae bacterium]|nr:glycosyltransferase family 39 protein [Lachnospiraceae bacterium]